MKKIQSLQPVIAFLMQCFTHYLQQMFLRTHEQLELYVSCENSEIENYIEGNLRDKDCAGKSAYLHVDLEGLSDDGTY